MDSQASMSLCNLFVRRKQIVIGSCIPCAYFKFCLANQLHIREFISFLNFLEYYDKMLQNL